jgi:hypothetical protein
MESLKFFAMKTGMTGFLLCCAVFFFSIGCKKDVLQPIGNSTGYSRYDISGRWSVVYSESRTDTGGVTIWGDTLYFPIKESYYDFKSDSTYNFYFHDTLRNYGRYHLDSINNQLVFENGNWPTILQFERPSFGSFWIKTGDTNQYNPSTISLDYYASRYQKF